MLLQRILVVTIVTLSRSFSIRHILSTRSDSKINNLRTNILASCSESLSSSLQSPSSLSPSESDASLDVLNYVDQLLSTTCSSSSSISNEAILERVENLLDNDYQCAIESPIILEVRNSNSGNNIKEDGSFEWMDGNNLVLQSVEPIFRPDEISTIRSAAEDLWTRQNYDTSRFTYQYPGNSEAHVTDLNSFQAIASINRALQEKLYPMIRENFCSSNYHGTLYVYDALVIRYNATAAGATFDSKGRDDTVKTTMLQSGQEQRKKGAGQPLHRDLGIVSVNIMLNDADQFEGGGTVFENDMSTGPKKPVRGVGHCVAHRSSERHAGAATYAGVRDILVFFVAGTLSRELQTSYIKQTCRNDCSCNNNDENGNNNNNNNIDSMLLCQVKYYRLAIEVSNDGESFLYLGTALMELAAAHSQPERTGNNVTDMLEAAIACFQQAKHKIPYDARVYNNLGIALSRLLDYQKQNKQLDRHNHSNSQLRKESIDNSAKASYQRGWELLEKFSLIGCNVENDLDSLTLNYGLYLANQDEFSKACDVLKHFAGKMGEGNDSNSKMIQDAVALFHFCNQQSQRAALQ